MAIETLTEMRMWIDGGWAESSSGTWIDVRNPATGQVIGRVPAGTSADVDRAAAAGRGAFQGGRRGPTAGAPAGAASKNGGWRSKWIPERVAILNKLADLIDEHTAEIAELETAQTGTALKLRRDSDIPFSADNLRFFATAIRHLEGKAAAEYSGSHIALTRSEPLGVVARGPARNY